MVLPIMASSNQCWGCYYKWAPREPMVAKAILKRQYNYASPKKKHPKNQF
jgi:hypothetical protein